MLVGALAVPMLGREERESGFTGGRSSILGRDLGVEDAPPILTNVDHDLGR